MLSSLLLVSGWCAMPNDFIWFNLFYFCPYPQMFMNVVKRWLRSCALHLNIIHLHYLNLFRYITTLRISCYLYSLQFFSCSFLFVLYCFHECVYVCVCVCVFNIHRRIWKLFPFHMQYTICISQCGRRNTIFLVGFLSFSHPLSFSRICFRFCKIA